MLFVRNVGQLSADSLLSHFKKYGEVQKVTIPKDITGEPKGFAFVTFDSVAEAKCAAFNGNEAEVRLKLLMLYCLYDNIFKVFTDLQRS